MMRTLILLLFLPAICGAQTKDATLNRGDLDSHGFHHRWILRSSAQEADSLRMFDDTYWEAQYPRKVYPESLWIESNGAGSDEEIHFDVRPNSIFITLSDFLAYAQECYNDSTLKQREVYQNTGNYAVYVEPKYIWVWEHREATFPGFLSWLRKNKQQ